MTSRDPRWREVTQKWCHLTGSHLEEAVEGRKLAYTVHFTSYKAVARRRKQSRDRKWRQGTSGDWKWPGSEVIWPSHLEVSVGGRKLTYSVHFTVYKAVTRSRRRSRDRKWRDLRWPNVTRKWRHLTGSHLEVAVGGRKLSYTVHFTSYKAVARRGRQWRDRKWRDVTSGDRKWYGSHIIWQEVTWKWIQKAENWRIQYISLPARL